VPEQTAYYLKHWPAGRRFVFSDTQQGADYLLATTRYDCNKVKGHVVHVVEREHVPLLYVIRLPHAASRKARHRGRGPRKRR
jgi:hypothetical protein